MQNCEYSVFPFISEMSESENHLEVEGSGGSRSRSKSPRSCSTNLNSSNRLAELRKRRGGFKGRLSHFDKFISNFCSPDLKSQDLCELKMRLESISEIFNRFCSVQDEIEEIISEDDLVINLEYREEFESIYYKLVAAAKCILKESEPKESITVGADSSVKVKLPQIKLPSFDGSFDQWLEFRNSYLTMIHTRKDLDPIHKFHYLRSSLSDTALRVINSLEFTAPNYAHAWELLENRFHNNRLLVHNHVKSLFTSPSLSKECPSQIRRLIDATLRNLRALQSLDEPTESWDTLIIYLVVSKLDYSTEREWETHKGLLLSDSRKKAGRLALDDLLNFLRNRADMLDMIKSGNNKSNMTSSQSSQFKFRNEVKQSSDHKKLVASTHTYSSVASNKKGTNLKNNAYRHQGRTCTLCGDDHVLYTCAKFLNMSIHDRWNLVKDKKLCQNCIRDSHSPNECVFGSCKLCNRKHNTLLHIDNSASCHSSAHSVQNASSQPLSSMTSLAQSADAHSSNAVGSDESRSAMTSNSLQPVLLSTALVELADSDNNYHTVRALLDSGSQNCFVTERLCKRLNVPVLQSTIRISGVGQCVSQSTHACNIHMRSKTYEFETGIKCLVLPSITSKLPSIDVDAESIRIPSYIVLADPTFNVSSEIDLLIGADIFWNLLNENKMRLPSGPYLHDSKLGWIISGPINNSIYSKNVQCNFVQIESQLRKFWELEEISNNPSVMSKDDNACEELFKNTTVRDETGRFSVRLPLKESTDSLGESYHTAKNRLLALERKLDRAPQYKRMYSEFLREYEELGHMSLVSGGIDSLGKPYYILPHHGVYRESSTTTKLRVVFAANVPTSSNKSLNDIQYVGPPLQNEIFSILLRFRQYQFVACADIEKMYRQIMIQSDQRNLQLILWRCNKDEPIKVYRLNTVTYGTTSAPYLSMRCLKQLALECNDDVIARVISEDFYVDDLITGHDDQQTLINICEKTSKVLDSACLPLRKWMFNSATSSNTKNLAVGENSNSKTLGLGWSNVSDDLNFTTQIDTNTSPVTKRLMLSVISQIYDPLGILAPAIIKAKILLQKLWLLKLDWQDVVPADVTLEWHNFISSLRHLHEIRVPRCVMSEPSRYKQLHIFTDASIEAYGACAYIRSFNDNDSPITVRLLCAKTKVAPLRSVSIPRLELCGALVGAKLYRKIKESLRLEFDKVYFWTDSTIVQAWVRMSPHLLKTFVQNRVSEINTLTEDSIWRHIQGVQNPADLLSRGVSIESLRYDATSLWWSGPAFLREPDSNWINDRVDPINTDIPELKSQVVAVVSTNQSSCIDFNRYSSFHRLQRIGAYCLRFIHNARAPAADRRTGYLSASELRSAVIMLTRFAQQQSFAEEYHNLKNSLPVSVKRCKQVNKINGLNIFMDHDGIMRVGGRLDNSSSFSYDKKHPMLLSSKHRLSELLFTYEHKRLLHGGPQLLVSTLRERWWVLGARNLARQVVHNCVTCARLKGENVTPLMGNLPRERIEASFPFMTCGVDYAGPMLVLNRKGRGARLIKCYICLFVCFTTKAIHLELVGSLSTQDYLLAFKRFISRRGKPSVIFSDNGRNFVGAEKEISATLDNSSQQVSDFASENNIKLCFIPAYSPHFGGLWESGVRRCKHHLRRIMGNAQLTHEEFITVLSQIEAVLNSRPLSPLSADPNDYLPLTPAHFLIGRPLTSPASEDLTSIATARLGRYDRVEQLRQHFWERWSKEYISELQRRTKWQTDGQGVKLDSLVIIKEDNLPPLKWKMGRITRLIPGNDGITRVVEIRTATGTIRRACTRICPLPIQSTMEEAD